MQRTQTGAEFSQPHYFSDSQTYMQSDVVRGDVSADRDGLSVFLNVRARLCAIAYRMLKSRAAAEDVVQDVWIRWQTTDRTAVRDATAFLATTTTRLAINVLQSARWCRETSVEAIPHEPAYLGADVESEMDRTEALEDALLLILEKLPPAERAAYVLREAFEYSHREIAKILRVQEANARQLVTRARRHIADDRHAAVNREEQHSFLAAFAAARGGTLSVLEAFFVGAVQGGLEEWPASPGRAHYGVPSWPTFEVAAA